MDVLHGHFSSFFQALATTNARTAVGPKKATNTVTAPSVPPAHCPMETIIIMLGPGAICPTLYRWMSCLKSSHWWTSTVRTFISGNAAMPPPTVNSERYENTRISAGIWFMASHSLSALCADSGTESPESQPRSEYVEPLDATGSPQLPLSL